MQSKISDKALVKDNSQSHLMISIISIILGSVFIATMAQIAFFLPFTPVPITLQTLGVSILAITLGPTHAFFAVITYLTQATFGLPVIAGGISNPFWFTGPTAGYLIGFAIAAFVTGTLLTKQKRAFILSTLLIFACNELIILTMGSTWLWLVIGHSQAFQMGFIPFIPGALFKIAISTSLYYSFQWSKVSLKQIFSA